MLLFGKYEYILGIFLKNLLFSGNMNKIFPFFMLIKFILEAPLIHVKWNGM